METVDSDEMPSNSFLSGHHVPFLVFYVKKVKKTYIKDDQTIVLKTQHEYEY